MRIRTSGAGKPTGGEAGFTYLVVMVAAAVMAILAGAAATLTSREVRIEQEAELLFRGAAYRRAIRSYREAGGGYPRDLEDLLRDPRVAGRRHLRRLYPDPFGSGEWTLILTPGGGIAGVASKGKEKPWRQSGFPPEFAQFEGAARYADWLFTDSPPRSRPRQPVH